MKKVNKKGFILGALAGVTLGVLFAPKKGSETRKDLKNKFDELLDKVKEIDVKEVKENIEEKINDIKIELENLDKERAIEIAKEKAEQIRIKADELVKYTKAKTTPAFEKLSLKVRSEVLKNTKKIVKKLEEE